MLKSILVCLDASSHSQVAIGLGIDWARRFGAHVAGLGVVDEPTIRAPEPVPLGSSGFKVHRDDAIVSEARQHVEAMLQQFRERCHQEGVSSEVIEEVGLPYEEIMLDAQRFDLVVVGQRANFHFRTGTPDDTLRRVLHDSPRPVVVVPPSPAGGKSILVAYNSSMPSARTLHAFGLSGLHQLDSVHVISVCETEEEAQDHVQRATGFFHYHHIEAIPHPIATDSGVAEVILEKARELDAGLIVTGAYSHSALREFFLGSVTRTILNESTVPLFMWH